MSCCLVGRAFPSALLLVLAWVQAVEVEAEDAAAAGLLEKTIPSSSFAGFVCCLAALVYEGGGFGPPPLTQSGRGEALDEVEHST